MRSRKVHKSRVVKKIGEVLDDVLVELNAIDEVGETITSIPSDLVMSHTQRIVEMIANAKDMVMSIPRDKLSGYLYSHPHEEFKNVYVYENAIEGDGDMYVASVRRSVGGETISYDSPYIPSAEDAAKAVDYFLVSIGEKPVNFPE